MRFTVEYHVLVRRYLSASFALFGLLALLFVSGSQAQVHGVPSSVTSPGFGGRAINGTPPSVTSLGPRGFAPNPAVTFSTSVSRDRDRDHDHDRHHRHNFDGEFLYYPYWYPVVPYAYDMGPTESADDTDQEDDADYQGGPTIFDRRGSGENSYVPPVRNASPHHSVQRVDTDLPAAPEPPQTPTVLVFKDGHTVEVGNYAIVGANLFDLTPGHARKVALADLDLDATQKRNDDRGVTFQLPLPAQAN
jgi:hypothetical protein